MKNTREVYYEMANWYDKLRQRGYFEIVDRIALKALINELKLMEKPSRILDMGCGPGRYLGSLSEAGFDIYGFDFSESMLKIAQKRINNASRIIQGEATELPFRDSSFDLVYSFKVLPHIKSIEQALKEIHRVLKPNGIAVVEFYNRNSIRYILNKIAKNYWYYTFWDTPKMVRNKMSSAGFAFMRSYGARIITPWGRMLDIPILRNILGKFELILCQSMFNKYAGYYIVTVYKDSNGENKRKKPRILFLSRPLIPPWDEANKNFTYLLWQNINKSHIDIDTVGTKGIQSSSKLIGISPQTEQWSVRLRLKILFDLLFHIRKYDIVNIFFRPRAYLKPFLKYFFRLSGVKVVQSLHCEPFRGEKLDSILFGDFVTVHSKYREKLLYMAGITNVVCIPSAIDLNKFNQQNDLPNFREIWNVRDEKVILYAGYYRNERDMDMILRAIKTVTADSMTVKFIMACRVRKRGFLSPRVETDELKNEINFKRRAKELKVEKHIIYMRTVENMPAIIAASDICIFPITEVGEKTDIPMVLIESMAMGKPVLMSSLYPFAEVLKYGGGIIISNEDVNGFSNALKTLITDDWLRNKIAVEGKNAVKKHFDIRKIAPLYQELYEKILDIKA